LPQVLAGPTPPLALVFGLQEVCLPAKAAQSRERQGRFALFS